MKRVVGIGLLILVILGAVLYFAPVAFGRSQHGWFLGFSAEGSMNECVATEQSRLIARTSPRTDDSWRIFGGDFRGYDSSWWPANKRFQWRIIEPTDTFWNTRRPRYAFGAASVDDRGVLTVKKQGVIAIEVREGHNVAHRVLYLMPPFRLSVSPNPIRAGRQQLKTFTINAVSVDGVRAPASPAPVVYGDKYVEARGQPSAHPRMFSPWTAQFFSVTTKETQYLTIRYFDQEVKLKVLPDPNAQRDTVEWPYPGTLAQHVGPPPDSAGATQAEIERATLMKNGCQVD